MQLILKFYLLPDKVGKIRDKEDSVMR